MPKFDEIKTVIAETYTRLLSPLTLFVGLVCWLIAVLAGPFGTYEAMGLGLRAFYWGVIVLGAVMIGFAVRAVTMILIGDERPVVFDLTATVLMTVIFAPLVILLRYWASMRADGLYLDATSVVTNTFILAGVVFVLHREISPHQPGGYLMPAEEPEPEEVQPRLLRRLPDSAKGEILRLSASDHHVEVATVNGQETLRLRLADAIAEMEPIEGYCTHRSHWVPRAAISGVERVSAHKLCLLLRNGDRVPVSRKYRADLEAAGIIETG